MSRRLNSDHKAIWIDLDNSPHVPLFAPIIKHYRDTGVEVIVTARDHSQTIALLDLHAFGWTYTIIGRHYGGNKLAKTWGLLARASKLVSHIKRLPTKPLVAVSHGSRSMVLAAKWLRIPVITMYDYEWTETSIFNRFSDRVLVPEMIPDDVLDRLNLPGRKRAKYTGIKEELYVRTFTPNADCRARFLVDGVAENDNEALVILRPPATTANYHSSQGDKLFDSILKKLAETPNVLAVVVPRTNDQADQIRRSLSRSRRSIVLDNAVNGLDLINAADVVISGGGTMNREAALLGVPVYSTFAGRQGALDAQMEKEGLITFVRDPDDVAKIVLKKRDRSAGRKTILTDRVERFVINQIDQYLDP